MTDQELIERFEDGTLSHEGFHHREHVRVGFLYLTKYPVLEALQAFSKALHRLAENPRKASALPRDHNLGVRLSYSGAHGESRKESEMGRIRRNNPDLLAWKDGILTRYYRPETLASDLARTIFVFPDLPGTKLRLLRDCLTSSSVGSREASVNWTTGGPLNELGSNRCTITPD